MEVLKSCFKDVQGQPEIPGLCSDALALILRTVLVVKLLSPLFIFF